jgi:restriction system-associated AAA family ATPase
MKLLRVHVIEARTCGGLLDGLDIQFRNPNIAPGFEPICLIGQNGTGKSQFLQVIAEIFQSILHAVTPREEILDGNPELLFEVEYLISTVNKAHNIHVKVTRKRKGNAKPALTISTREGGKWNKQTLSAPSTPALIPAKIVGYTSGGNETLSSPFLRSRYGYAERVGKQALRRSTELDPTPDTRLMLIDYQTHLEVLVANLLVGTNTVRKAILGEAKLDDIHSFRCIIQLGHRAAPKISIGSGRPGIQLTQELETHLDHLRRCSTCHTHLERTDTYIFDYFVDGASREAFKYFWSSVLDFYSALHKFTMLNDLALSKEVRDRFWKEAREYRFASRPPEPQDEDKAFRFDQVTFHAKSRKNIVDYVAISDGEHQLAQLLGTFAMIDYPNVLFLLDEPESHFNPQWRVKFSSRLLDLPTANGPGRKNQNASSAQDCLLTTHTPFVASDTPKDRVFIFRKNHRSGRANVKLPEIETFGSTYDAILEQCFDVSPPISQVARNQISNLMKSKDPDAIKAGMQRLGYSVDKVFLADHLQQLLSKTGK